MKEFGDMKRDTHTNPKMVRYLLKVCSSCLRWPLIWGYQSELLSIKGLKLRDLSCLFSMATP